LILLSKPAPMRKVVVACPLEYREKAVFKLQEAGVIDIEVQQPEKVLAEYEALRRLRDEIMSILSKIPGFVVRAELYGAELAGLTIDKIEADVREVSTRVTHLESELSNHRRVLEDLQALDMAIRSLPSGTKPRNILYRGRYLSSILVIYRNEAENQVLDQRVMGYERYPIDKEMSVAIVVVETSRLSDYLSHLKSVGGWAPGEWAYKLIESCEDVDCLRRTVSEEINRTASEIAKLEEELRNVVVSSSKLLGKYFIYIENRLQQYTALGNMLTYKHLVALVGWIPADSVDELRRVLESSEIPLFLEIKDPSPEDNPPTLMRNKKPLNFYQLIVRLYGVPSYREWDPTPLVAYSFALFFGLMNADVGYSLLGILATVLLLDKLVDNPESQPFKELKGVLILSNIVGLALGIASGTILGNALDYLARTTGITVPVLLPALQNPIDFIKLSLIIGLVHVNIGHILAAVKSTREKKTGDILNEAGILVSEVFGIPYVLKAFMRYQVPILGGLSDNLMLIGILVGMSMIVTGMYLNMRALGLFMWIFQITGVLGDVLSYVRLAGVGLATYYMAMAFNQMSEMVYGAIGIPLLGVLAALPIVVLTHVIVLALAQLGAFIHSLRLCMLEFLTKFYEGNGREYNPLKLIKSAVIVPR